MGKKKEKKKLCLNIHICSLLYLERIGQIELKLTLKLQLVQIGQEEPSLGSEVIIILWLVVKEKSQFSDPSPVMLPTCIMTARHGSNRV